jgi:UDPglucose 6-dehydrogenase
MNPKTGECDISIVEESVEKYKAIVDYFLIKSTVAIGTTDYLKDKYKVNIAMSPEYVGETLGHPLTEPKRDTFLILGGYRHTTDKISEFWRLVLNANSQILICTAIEAEIIKYCENYWIMQRVDYWNDVYDICDTFKCSFDMVREGLVLDPRLGRTHSFVYPKNRGWSGKCLSKDMPALASSMRKMKKPLSTLEHQIEKNARVRKDYNDKNKLIPDDWRKK